MISVTVVRAKPGGYAGSVHPAVLDAVRQAVADARERGSVTDAYVARCGVVVGLVAVHEAPHAAAELARDAFGRATAVAADLGQHGAAHAAGNGGLPMDAATLRFPPRADETIACLLAAPAPAGAFDRALYRTLADPVASPALLGPMIEGCSFSTETGRFELPEDLHRMLASAGRTREVRCRASWEPVAAVTAGADPALLVRAEHPFPPLGDGVEAFAGGCLLPVSSTDDACSRPSIGKVIGLGFQLAGGRLVGPRDLLGDRSFDVARRRILERTEAGAALPAALVPAGR